MDDWEKLKNETSLPEKVDFYNHLCMEDITDANYTHGIGVCKDFSPCSYHSHLLFIFMPPAM